MEDVDQTWTKAKSPRTNGICERFHKALHDEFHRFAFRKRVNDPVETLQAEFDAWIADALSRTPKDYEAAFYGFVRQHHNRSHG